MDIEIEVIIDDFLSCKHGLVSIDGQLALFIGTVTWFEISHLEDDTVLSDISSWNSMTVEAVRYRICNIKRTDCVMFMMFSPECKFTDY